MAAGARVPEDGYAEAGWTDDRYSTLQYVKPVITLLSIFITLYYLEASDQASIVSVLTKIYSIH